MDHTWTQANGAPFGISTPLVHQTPSGAAYGGQIGCDYQFNNNWVVGIRGMWDGASLKATDNVPLLNIGNFAGQAYNTKIDAFETLVGRLGFLVSPNVMIYGVGGVAWMQDRFSVINPPGVASSGQFTAARESRTGYDIGAGFSWMFAPNWDFWLEYDHMGFGNHTITTSFSTVFGANFGFAEKQNIDKVLVGLNYRFHTGR